MMPLTANKKAWFLLHSTPTAPLFLVNVGTVTIVIVTINSYFITCDGPRNGSWVFIRHIKIHISRFHSFWTKDKFCSNTMHIQVYLEDQADSVTDSNQMKEAMDCLMTVLMDKFMNFSPTPTFYVALLVICHPKYSPSWTDIQLPLKHTCHSENCVQSKECLPKAWTSTLMVSAADLTSFMQNRCKHVAQICQPS